MCRDRALVIDGDAVEVMLNDNRRHRVVVEEREGDYRLMSVALGKVAVERSDVTAARIWEMNRALNLVGFRIDNKGRLVAETWLPKEGLEADEFRFALRNLATECDRYEFMLTGKDVH